MERAPQSGKSRIDDSPSDVPDEHTCKNPVDNPVDSPSVSTCFLLPCGAVAYFQLQSLIPIRVKGLPNPKSPAGHLFGETAQTISCRLAGQHRWNCFTLKFGKPSILGGL